MMTGRVGTKSPGWVFLVLFFLFASCGEHVVDDPNGGDPDSGTGGLVVEDPFDFDATQTVTLRLKAYDYSGNPMPGIRFDVYDKAPSSNGTPGTSLFTGASNSSGLLVEELELLSSADSVYIQARIIGFLNQMTVPIINGEINWTLGESLNKGTLSAPAGKGNGSNTRTYYFLGEWYRDGVPKYLESVPDIIGLDLLRDIDASLPEYRPVPEYHPEYLAEGTESNIVTLNEVELWITFVHEGAGYTNAVGYYSYDVGSPPESVEDIDSLRVIFPNFSYEGGGGGLNSGDKVYLGKFPAGKEIGWFVVANGWDSAGETVGDGYNIFFSDPALNPEPNANQRQHNALIYDPLRGLLVIGFEDLNRTGGDNDFNDAVFYITASDIEDLVTDDLPELDVPDDCDGDGVDNNSDDYPCDPLRTFDLPAEIGTIAFDDEWPTAGDFDYNDLIVDYSSKLVTDADNKVRDIFIDFVLRANGSEKQNGFGFQLPDVDANAISMVSGMQLSAGYVSLGASNLEAGQSKPTIIVFDNAYDLMPVVSSGDYVNTQRGVQPVPYDTISIAIAFNWSVVRSDVGDAPYNPFVIIDGERGRELHAKGQEPTDLVNESYFGSGDDKSNLNANKFYYLQNNLTWVLEIPISWDYPFESVDVTNAYNHWRPWVESSGVSHQDWYEDFAGYREEDKIYYPYGSGKR